MPDREPEVRENGKTIERAFKPARKSVHIIDIAARFSYTYEYVRCFLFGL